jgi:hypothetical protein
MACRKQVYKLTYPNGKIYAGMDLTRSLLYVGSPASNVARYAQRRRQSRWPGRPG